LAVLLIFFRQNIKIEAFIKKRQLLGDEDTLQKLCPWTPLGDFSPQTLWVPTIRTF